MVFSTLISLLIFILCCHWAVMWFIDMKQMLFMFCVARLPAAASIHLSITETYKTLKYDSQLSWSKADQCVVYCLTAMSGIRHKRIHKHFWLLLSFSAKGQLSSDSTLTWIHSFADRLYCHAPPSCVLLISSFIFYYKWPQFAIFLSFLEAFLIASCWRLHLLMPSTFFSSPLDWKVIPVN